MAKLRANPRFYLEQSDGTPAEGWKVHTYIAGTSTLKDTYTTYDEGAANTNPVILDERGEADIWWAGTYKIVVKDDSGVTIFTVDNYGEGEEQVLTGNYNLVKNGSFEVDSITSGEPDDWTIVDYPTGGSGAGVHSLDATDQYHGLNSLKFTSVGDGGGYATSDYFDVQEAKDVTLNWSMKSSVATVRNVVDVLWYTSAKTLISTSNIYDDSATNPTSWTAKDGEGTPPSTAKYAQLRVYGCHSSDATSGSTWFDNVVGNDIPTASTTARGTVEKATQAEVTTGTDTDRYVTPETLEGIKASQAETDAGTETKNYLTPASLAAYTPVSPSTWIGGIEYHLHGTAPMILATQFDIDSNVTEAAWESCGDSSATNEISLWEATMPSTAIAAVIKISASGYDSSTAGVYNLAVYARVSGTGSVNNTTRIYNHRLYSTTSDFVGSESTAIVPIDSNQHFDIYWTHDGDTQSITLNWGGWIEAG